jgi:TatD DNase family protein
VDSHCHLNLSEFDADRKSVIARARSVGVDRIVVPGIDLATSRAAVALAGQEEGIFAAIGVHPHHAADLDETALAELRSLAGSPGVVAIGEIGLDYFRNLAPAEVQRSAFEQQLELAAALELPVIVHTRDAAADVISCLLDWVAALGERLAGRRGVLHAFSSGEQIVSAGASAGFYFGVAGPITFRNAEERRRVSAALPSDRVLVETDAPYLTPHPNRGRRNEPAYTLLVAEKLAEVKNESFSRVASTTSANAARLFGWDDGTDNRYIL